MLPPRRFPADPLPCPAGLRRTALSVACLIALTPGAHAQSGAYDTNYATGATATTQALYLGGYTLSLTENQAGSKAISGLVSGVGVVSTLSATDSAATPVAISSTRVDTFGSANQSTSLVDLGLLSGTGLAVMTGQSMSGTSSTTTGGVATTSKVQNSAIQVSQTGMGAAPITILDNALSANTILNQSVTLVTGSAPTTFSSSAKGSVTLKQTATTQESGNPVTPTGGTTASVNLGTYQSTFNAGARAGSKASMDNVDVVLTLSGTTDGSGSGTPVLDAPLTVGANRIAADYTGNVASTVYSAGAGSGTFAGSVAVTSAQSNVETLTVGATNLVAQVTGSTISADLRQQGAGTRTDLGGALTMSGNSLSASATGNLAGTRTATGGVQAGNAILVDGASAISGSGSATSFSLPTHWDPSIGNVAQASADLAVVNAQYNQGSSTRAALSAGAVTARADSLGTGGSVSITDNALGASAAGNVAGSLVYGDVTKLSGSVAAVSVQNSINTPVEATNTGSTIGAGVGVAGATSVGRMILGGNAITADAQGNLASTGVTLSVTELVAVAAGGARAAASASAITSDATVTSGTAGVMVANAQRVDYSYTGTRVPVTASLTGGTVAANFTESGSAAGIRTNLDAATVTLTGNRIAATSAGNTATSSANLSANDATLQASVVSTQHVELGTTGSGAFGVLASASGAGIAITAGGVGALSALAIEGNAVAVVVTANDADNSLVGNFTNLSVAANPVVSGSTTGTTTSAASAKAALNVANRQHVADAPVTVTNLGSEGFATIRAGSTGIAGIDSSAMTVTGNAAGASVSSNQATNRLQVAASTIDTGGAAAQQVAALSNVQTTSTNAGTATVGASITPSVPLVGIQFQQSLSASGLAVSGNAVSGSSSGNRADNTLAVSGGTLVSGAPPASSGSVSAGVTSDTVSSEFALASLQSDINTRGASASYVVIGIDGAGTLAASGVDGSKLTVTGNTVSADTRSNDAVNALSLTGFATLSSGAGVASSQSASATKAASVTGTELRISLSGSTAVTGSELSLTGNVTRATAVGNAGSSRLVVDATALSGNAAPSGSTASAAATSPTTVDAVVNADFGVGNSQTQTGTVIASTSASGLVSLSGASVTDGAATIDGNATRAIARGNVADNALKLSGSGISGVSAGVANAQYADKAVKATQNTTASGASFAVRVASTEDTVSTVSGNEIGASAVMNEALNALSVSGSTVEGRAGTSFAVSNAQRGASGASVTSTALPGLLGVSSTSIGGSATTVSGNAVGAKSTVNQATNALTLDAEALLSGNGQVQNSQSNFVTASATVGDTAGTTISTIGIAAPVVANGVALNGTNVNVSGTSLNAQSGGNTASNALNATAGSGIGAGTAPTFAVLNTQASTGAMTAQLAYANVGAWGAGTGGAFGGTAVTVQGNQASASAYANTASNAVATSVLPGSQNAASTSVGNSQSNSGAVSATASNVNFGATASGSTGGGAIVASGNMTLAQASGNTAVNRVIGR